MNIKYKKIEKINYTEHIFLKYQKQDIHLCLGVNILRDSLFVINGVHLGSNFMRYSIPA